MNRGRRSLRPAALALVALVLVLGAACGDDDDVETTTGADDVPADPDAPVSNPDGSVAPPGPADETFPSEAARDQARSLLGAPESELAPDVRVARRGAETFALTEDYVLGRITVELDDDGSGTYVVTSARVELPDGPETFQA